MGLCDGAFPSFSHLGHVCAESERRRSFCQYALFLGYLLHHYWVRRRDARHHWYACQSAQKSISKLICVHGVRFTGGRLLAGIFLLVALPVFGNTIAVLTSLPTTRRQRVVNQEGLGSGSGDGSASRHALGLFG